MTVFGSPSLTHFQSRINKRKKFAALIDSQNIARASKKCMKNDSSNYEK